MEAHSWLRPQLRITIEELEDGGCSLHLNMLFNRTSVLFQVCRLFVIMDMVDTRTLPGLSVIYYYGLWTHCLT